MILKFFNKNFYVYLFFVFLIFISDRLSKIYIINESFKNLDNFILKSTYLNIRLIWNQGIAFGLMSLESNTAYNILTFFILIICIIILYVGFKEKGFKKYCFLMVFAGGIGNLYDRIFFKAVPDFIDFHINGFHWFVFNVADIFISIGIIFLIFFEFLNLRNKDNLGNK